MSEGVAAVAPAPAPATPSGVAATPAAVAPEDGNGNTNANANNGNGNSNLNASEARMEPGLDNNETDNDGDGDADGDGDNDGDGDTRMTLGADTSGITVDSPPATASSTPQKERHSLTLDQRRALRRWANAQVSRPSHKQCIEWFQRQYHQTISQSTVSHSLSPKYARLDGEPQLSGSRLRFGNWPEVEKLVLLWYQQMAHAGRHPTNEELAEKAKNIFAQLPRHHGEEPPEFSPGWIHRFKKRYGLLIRRQRRQSDAGSGGGGVGGGGRTIDPANDVAYLTDAVPQIMSITADTNPVAIRETVMRQLGIEPSIAVCTRVRDAVARYGADQLARQQGAASSVPPAAAGAADQALAGGGGPLPTAPGLATATTESQASAATAAAAAVAAAAAAAAAAGAHPSPAAQGDHDSQQQLQQLQQQQQPPQQRPNGNGGGLGASMSYTSSVFHPHPDDDPETVLQNALRQLKQDEAAAAEAEAAAAATGSTNVPAPAADMGGPATTTAAGSAAFSTAANRPVRCPFCVNQRMLRTIKEAVDHMSTHVVV
ncbi:centromere-binding protein [Niveomyces insectorum RCEF 264]|uniref:Centromere-binding protein n=1 Tax=Niveomyces insectorum RCEF 264 TaxID=1081102 RepID=A0A167PVC8_9HYPO|nr:centromere-binding protein [Niveomyces insectorum RCEF 264]